MRCFGRWEYQRVLFAWCLVLGAVGAGGSCLLNLSFWEMGVPEGPVCLVSCFGSWECQKVLFAWCLVAVTARGADL
jgi:hypothetical protein